MKVSSEFLSIMKYIFRELTKHISYSKYVYVCLLLNEISKYYAEKY